MFEQVIDDLTRDEGLRLRPYKCTAGKLTIGIGRNYEDNPFTVDELTVIFKETGITEGQAKMLLMNDLKKTHKQLVALFKDFETFPENVQRVLLNMHFNLGDAGFRSLTTLITGIKKKDWKYCAQRMAQFKWAKQVGARALRLIRLMEQEG